MGDTRVGPRAGRDDAAVAGVSGGGIASLKQQAAGLLELDRPGVLNAITPAMCAKIGDAIRHWGSDPGVYAVVLRSGHPRVFSAGGDIRAALETARRDPLAARADLRLEYSLNWQLDCFSKPMVALIDGLVMGSGVGISQYGTHRVAGEGYAFAVPECALGLIPDVGQCWVLARLPEGVGMYLALTGRRIGRADAFALGLATHALSRAAFADVIARLANAEPVDPVLDDRHADPGAGDLAPFGELIGRCFSADTVENIRARLDATQGAHAELARNQVGCREIDAVVVVLARGLQQRISLGIAAAKIGDARCQAPLRCRRGGDRGAPAADIDRASPLALKITHRFIRMARGLDLRQTLIQDYRIVSRLAFRPDLAEGARAILIDKDRRPHWSHASLRAVADAEVDRYFAPADDGDLALPSRTLMQTPAL